MIKPVIATKIQKDAKINSLPIKLAVCLPPENNNTRNPSPMNAVKK